MRESSGKRPQNQAQKESRGSRRLSHTKYLQNDEFVDYALGHSDLFYPFLALSELSIEAEPPRIQNKANAATKPCGSVQRSRRSKGKTRVQITGFSGTS